MAKQPNTTNPSRRAILTGIPAAAIGIGVLGVDVAASAEQSDAELIALGHRLRTAWDAETTAFAIIDDGGPLEAHANQLYDATSAIVERIEVMRARTLAGFRVKALAASWTHSGEEFTPDALSVHGEATTDDRLACSIIRDLLTINI